ncbi:hypothetical protein CVT24_003221 [Panaeolus cyanescens]|uniref:Carboxylesterase type B domain-containing protein n=1 Tax=Panaeolus cyanescens TaxID=181874 RepID=A0A409VFV9_9AGAR|nr:hypothetical protein CVT24_003221 [Panaeolus cyanescens]
MVVRSFLDTQLAQMLSGALYLLTLAAAATAAAPQVKIGGTTFTGRDVTLFKQDFFGGIPFAEPPLGNLRLRPPVLKTRLQQKTFDASNFGKGCLQVGGTPTTFSEDCLTINVFRPSGLPSTARLPVLFWTYGGGFQDGESSIYNGSAIVAQSVARGTPLVYVNFNYRLGPLGFPQGQEGTVTIVQSPSPISDPVRTADDKKALNLALKDQLAALEWVQANIGFFGGDKTKVTVFGQSAGAIMTAILFLNPSIEKLARGAIFESGSAATALEFPASRREVDWQNFVAGVPSCASLATSGKTFDCLRHANSTEILSGLVDAINNADELFGFDPTIDGPGGLFPDIASRILKTGKFAKLPFIAGTNLDEGTIFTPTTGLTQDDIRANIIASYSPPLVDPAVLAATADRLLELYPDDPSEGSPFGTGVSTFGLPSGFKREAAIQGDLSFHSQRRSWIQTASRAGVKTFGYLFTQPQPNGDPADGVAHGSEVFFVYGVPSDQSPSSLHLSSIMIDYWVSFATSLDPNDGKGNPRPLWPQYTPANEVLLQLNGDNTTTIPDDYRKEQIDFINSDPTVFHHRRGLNLQMLLRPFCLFTLIAGVLGAAPQVKIGATTFTGRDVTLFKQDFFGGIPFAEPPLGNLRLKPPVLKTRLTDKTFDASNFGKGCLQPGGTPTTFSEDCLTINVFRPSGLPKNARLPVLFWTYGGGFQQGASSIYNGSAIVAQSVARGTPLIYVNFNYRLGPLGFPQGQEADDKKALNLALKDQLAALEWVQANIEFFGGDKKKVTAFGESAGAIMTAVLFLNSPIDKLARAAIFESGSAATALEFNAARREVDWQNFVAGVPSCASLATSGKTFDCLRNANSTEMLSGVINAINNANELFGFDPTIDGPGGLFPDIASTFLKRGHFAKLPFIAGTNLDEGTVFTPRTSLTQDDLRADIIASYSPPLVDPAVLQATADKLLELYPDDPAQGSPFGTGASTFGLPSGFKRDAAIQGDLSFQSQRRSWIQTASRAGVKTFGYLFTQPQPDSDPSIGVFHGSEVVFVYGAPSDPSPSALHLSSIMIDYWVSFATSLDPNDGKGNARPNWPQYTPSNEVLLQLNGDNTTTIPDDYRKEQIDFINSEPTVFHHRRALKI